MSHKSQTHSFHITVMGLAYTVDSPIKVAKYGISSVISIVDDFLIEKMNEYYSNKFKIPYQEISTKVEDYRAKRITAYLNTVDTIAKQTFSNLKKSFEEKISDAIERATISDIVSKYKDNVLGENAEFNNEGDTTFLSGDYQIDILSANSDSITIEITDLLTGKVTIIEIPKFG